MNRYRLVHTTEFVYDGPVSESYNEVRLRPLHDERQSCLSFRLTTNPGSRGTAYRDAHGNWVHQFNVLAEHQHLKVEAESVVLAHEVSDAPADPATLAEFDSRSHQLDEEYFDFMAPTGYVPHLACIREIVEVAERASGGTVVGFAQAAADLIHQRFRYVKGATHVHSSIEDSLSIGAGVCQDFAHVLLGVVRMRGIPGRYVSGYLVPGSTAAPDAKQEDVIGGQASHAWVEVLMPNSGWMGFDPTLGKPVGLRHVRIAYGRDYGDVAPVRGVYKGHAGQSLSVDVRVRPAIDDAGCEQLNKITVGNVPAASVLERPQQPAQQQQQQQQ
ncbi:MAG TPA: transglutaminase family protein [Candidatus Acidoferrales bacterium]|nr:transglutaminase family protein [Candidatus Acidoferrales bacterium]